jgi:site-specific DNA recombinase
MRAIIYCRVSTDRQVKQGASLEVQRKACLEYCEKQGWEVIHIFMEEGESAQSLDRTELRRLTEFCQKQKHRVDVMVVHSIDRFARETLDHKILRSLLMSYGVTLRSVTQPAIDDSPEGDLMEQILSGIAQYDNRLRARRTVSGMKAKMQKGGWPFKAPLGYRNSVAPDGRKTLVHDALRSPLVKAIFEMFSGGLYTKQQILKHFNLHGLRTLAGRPLSAQTLSRMLRNPLYAGIIKVEGKKVKDWGMSEKGDFEQIVSLSTFQKVQDVLSGKQVSSTPRKRNHPDFPLRNFVRCVSCGRALTGSWSRGRNGTRYAFYRCQNRVCTANKRNLKRHDIERGFIDFLRKLQPNRDHAALFRAIVLDTWQEKRSSAFEKANILEKKVSGLRDSRRKLNNARIVDEVLSHEEYLEMKAGLESELVEAEFELREAKSTELDVETLIGFAETVMSDAARMWQEMSPDQKQRFQQLLFPKGVQYGDGVYRTASTCLMFNHVQAGDISKDQLVALPGIEPGFED